MPTHEIDHIERVLDSPYGVDCPFDENFDEDKAIDEYIRWCLGE